MTLRIAGIELGGTKCVATLGDGEGHVLEQTTVPTTQPDITLPALSAILADWAAKAPFDALGIGSFGPVGLTPGTPDFGHITATAKPGWRDTDVLHTLCAPYAVPCHFDTDVNAAALAEQRWGAAKGLRDFAYVTVGTGVGVGLIVNGHATRGLGHCEMGHIRVPRLAGDTWPGHCPYHGDCVEGLAAGPAIKARLGQEYVHDIPADHPLWDSVTHALAQMCHTMLMATGPRRILIGGGVANGQPHLRAMIERHVRESVAGYIPLPEETFILAPGLGDQAGPLGAIALGLNAWEEQAR
ncbi:ROK family protein [Novosphingobium humi]|uniref:fructokinase n=1 Tax=Novosphingobium humi TaxID=2282397 RepID=A0ABY7U5M7_9SPHN|nr:ROK family protein [Novosphingobium humi]WCT79900.1 ROK family protein [Novosphingobium humi]